MQRLSLLLALPLPALASPLVLNNPAAIPQTLTLSSSAAAFAANDALPLKQLDGDWTVSPRTRDGVAKAVGTARAELAVAHHGWQVSAFYRAEAWASASEDALDLVYQDKNDLKPTPGRRYDADYRLETFSARGVGLARSFELPALGAWRWQAGVGVSLLDGLAMREDKVAGSALALSEQQYQLQATRTLRYTGLDTSSGFNPYLGDASPSARGYALDLALAWQWQDAWQGRLLINDALGELRWRDLPTSTLQADSDVALDANGNRQPLASGQDSRADYTQKLHSKTELAASYRQQAWETEASLTRYRDVTLPQLRVRYHGVANWQFGLAYESRFKTAGVEIRHRYFRLGVHSDGRSPSNSRATGVHAGLFLPL
ncbi:DUF5723 family protein [Craterilacuibacter sp. RT1T]|uniref:DUF5723 family protein n=1 Tax=Craterilacuibacter sp. RT1T TaxID=2942211 RepID=UPI0020C0E964|nr:DUF5723 family protein [Craterilacuibacter sp. RT1T]MCL6263604.1 DUF5723 family protein [Craterilacuibacter sp. RT1T]